MEEVALARAAGADECAFLALPEDEVRVLEDERATPGFSEVAARVDVRNADGTSPSLRIGFGFCMDNEPEEPYPG
jgi:hypothetical protein